MAFACPASSSSKTKTNVVPELWYFTLQRVFVVFLPSVQILLTTHSRQVACMAKHFKSLQSDRSITTFCTYVLCLGHG